MWWTVVGESPLAIFSAYEVLDLLWRQVRERDLADRWRDVQPDVFLEAVTGACRAECGLLPLEPRRQELRNRLPRGCGRDALIRGVRGRREHRRHFLAYLAVQTPALAAGQRDLHLLPAIGALADMPFALPALTRPHPLLRPPHW
jgi:hypothetical protein